MICDSRFESQIAIAVKSRDLEHLAGAPSIPISWASSRSLGLSPRTSICFQVDNAPTCYRAPKWPDPEFPRKIPKKYPPARNSGLQEFTPKIPRKYRKNTPKIPKMHILVFFWYFWGIFLGFQNFGPRGIFSVFFVGPSRGSVAGRGVLNFQGPFEHILGPAAPASVPPMRKRDAQHKLKHHTSPQKNKVAQK